MTIAETLGAGVETALDCARAVGQRVREQVDPIMVPLLQFVLDPLGRHRGPVAPALPAPSDPQAQVEESKYYLGAASRGRTVDREPGELPRAYGQDRLLLLARDPWWLFAWWEITPTTRVHALRELGTEGEGAREVLRISDGTSTFDIELTPGAESWYVNVGRPAATFSAEIGLRTTAGRFVSLAHSNMVATPPAHPSPDTTVRWVRLQAHGAPVEIAREWSGPHVNGETAPDLGTEASRSSDTHARP